MNPLIRAEQLDDQFAHHQVVLLDARGGADAQQRFAARSLPGAIFVDWDTDLSTKRESPANGGRHPLPTPRDFVAKCTRWGIGPETHVVIFDDKGGANAAARAWWMFKALGHSHVAVLDGGLSAVPLEWHPPQLAAVERTLSSVATTDFGKTDQWQLPTADLNEVEIAARNRDYLVVDVREGFRYRGESEPIDLVAGHIPGAVNCPYTENLDAQGRFLPPNELRMKYQDLFSGREPGNVIIHCGSGVTACHTLLALCRAGLDGAKLYVGSWSEWSRNDKPIATGS
ncbi:MAG: sulfurtransferase [Planctomycetaceae bacterium]|nr:sulfurtransferase [Planctomycetaceae bacterium]